MTGNNNGVYDLYGMSCSYYTGKLEAYLNARGIPYRAIEMNRRQFKACAEATGIAQLPCIQAPDGSWLTDTTAIIDHFESRESGRPLRSQNPATAFCSLLLEDLFDEWYWRPALYYRWAFDTDARLMSEYIARTLVRDVPLPLFVRRQFILRRQRHVYLKKDGVTRQTAPLIEALYLDTLRELNGIFSRRPFLFGEVPCEADYGLFGPFFRHFFCDPTPGRLMRDHGPQVAHWVTRVWKTRPGDIADLPPVARVPDDLGFFFEMLAKDYLPYLEANAQAVIAGEKTVSYQSQGVVWTIPAAPYRVACFNALKRRLAELDPQAAGRVSDLLPAPGMDLLKAPTVAFETPADAKTLRGRLWRPASVFD